MEQYFTYILLSILLTSVYQKPRFFMNLSKNKILKIILILLNAYIARIYGIMNGVIVALIIIVLLHNEEEFTNKKPSKKDLKNTISEAKKMLDKAVDTASNQLDDEEEEENANDNTNEESFVSKIQIWKPEKFTNPCQVDLDRYLKIKSEKYNLDSTKQLNGHTNDGFKIPQKQLY